MTIGGVADITARDKPCRKISHINTESTWWFHEHNANNNLHINWGNNRTDKCKICREYLPVEIRELLLLLIDCDMWIAVVGAG